MKSIRIASTVIIITLIVAACSNNQEGLRLKGGNDSEPVTTATPVVPVSSSSNIAQISVVQESYYKTEAHINVLIGEVKNNGTERVTAIKLHARLINQDGKVVGTSNDISDFQLNNIILAPSQSAGFVMDIVNEGEWSKEDIQVEAAVYSTDTSLVGATDPQPLDGLTVGRADLSGNASEGYTLSGTIINASSNPAYLINAIATAYDTNGKLIDVAIGMGLPSQTVTNSPRLVLLKGNSAQFEARFRRKGVEIEKYDVIAIGAKYHG